MRTKPFAMTTMALAATLGMVLYNPLAGSSGCSADRGSNVIQKIGDGGSGEKSPAKATAAKEDSKTGSNTDETQDTITDAAEAQPNANSNSSATPQAGLNKTGSSKSNEPKGNDSQPAQPKKKWGPEQSHRGTEHTVRYGCPISSIRATSAAFVLPAELSSIPNLASTPIATPCGPKVKAMAATLTTPTPPKRTKDATNSRPQDSTGSLTLQAIRDRQLLAVAKAIFFPLTYPSATTSNSNTVIDN